MLFDTKGLRVFVYGELIDMRSGFERLHYFAKEKMKAEVNQGHVYLFFGKNRGRIKAIYYDGTGLVLVSKRIERGSFMNLFELNGRCEINLSELKLIFHGSVIRKPVLERSNFSMTQRESLALPNGIKNDQIHASP